jgi:hypothetical protein
MMQGGKVRGPGTATSDSILARVSNGEYVLPKPAVDLVGVQNLNALRQAALAQSLPGYALGGEVNEYGNDLTLTNRMNAGAESMRRMREGPMTQPTQQPVTGLSSLFGPTPQQQQQQAYSTARSGADALDVASGRFDREYQPPRFAAGGSVGMSQNQWEGLPRFQTGGWLEMEETIRKAREEAATNNAPMVQPWVTSTLQNVWQGLTGPTDPTSLSRMPGAQLPRFNQPQTTAPAPATPASPLAPIAPAAPASAAPAMPRLPARQPMEERWSALTAPQAPVQAPATTGNGLLLPTEAQDAMRRGSASMAGAMQQQQNNAARAAGQNYADQYVARSGGQIINPAAPGAGGLQTVVAGNSNRVGTAQVPDVGQFTLQPGGGATNVVRGSSVTERPVYETNYTVFGKNGQQGTATVTGPNQRVGGGTLSVLDQGNGGTVEGNVAALNRQLAALQSRNQAYGWGGGNGGGMPAGPDAQTLAALANPFYQAGQGFGDEVLNRDRFMRQFERKPGEFRKSWAQRQQTGLAQLNGLQEQGQQRMQGALGLAGLGQRQQQAGYEAQLAQQKALQDAQQWAATHGLERRKVGLSEANAGYEAQRNAGNDALNAAKTLADIQRGNRPTADAVLGQARANYMQALVAGDQPAIQQWKSVLDQFGQPTPYFAQ